MSCRVEHLAVVHAEMVELERLAEVGKKLRRHYETCHSVLEAGQLLLGGQQRLDKIGQRIELKLSNLRLTLTRSNSD